MQGLPVVQKKGGSIRFQIKEVITMERDLEDLFDSESASNAGVFDQQHCQNYVWIWESELQFTAGVAARWIFTEAGGEFFGSLTPGGRLVISLATGPGDLAIHKVAEFVQDIDFLRKTGSFLRNNFALWPVGNHHSHPINGLDGPSSIDIRSTHSIAQKNGYQRFAQFVLTHEKDHCQRVFSRSDEVFVRPPDDIGADPRSDKGKFKDGCHVTKVRFASSRQINFIRIHPYIYLDAANGRPIRCRLRILRGTSPFRRAIMRNSIIPELTRYYKFPMDRILLDESYVSGEHRDHVAELPARICRQLHELPEAVLEDTRITFKEGLIILSLPIPGAKGRILIGYNERPPHRVKAVFLRRNEKPAHPIEITKQALCFDPLTSLARIYKRVGYLVNREISPAKQDHSIETAEKQGKKEERTIEQRQESQTVKEGDEYLCY
jgi:hypothetical protein